MIPVSYTHFSFIPSIPFVPLGRTHVAPPGERLLLSVQHTSNNIPLWFSGFGVDEDQFTLLPSGNANE